MKSLSASRLGRVHETGDVLRATTGVSRGHEGLEAINVTVSTLVMSSARDDASSCLQCEKVIEIYNKSWLEDPRVHFQHEHIQPPNQRSNKGQQPEMNSLGQLTLPDQPSPTWTIISLLKDSVRVLPPMWVAATLLVARRALSECGLTSSATVLNRGSAVAK